MSPLLKKLAREPAVVIFALTVVSYLMAFGFEVGYLRIFGINYQSAQVEIGSLALFYIALAFFSIVAWFIYKDVVRWRRLLLGSGLARMPFLGRLLQRLLDQSSFVVVLLLAVVCFVFNKSLILFCMLVVIWSIVAFLVDPSTIWQDDNKTEMWQAPLMGLAGLALTTLCVGMALGMLYGRYETTYKCFTYDNKTYLVIREYHGQIIAKRIQDGIILGEIRYLSPDGYKEVTYEVVERPITRLP